MPNCHLIDPLVTPFVDGELPENDRRLVEDHMRVCAPCHSRVVAERAVHTIIRARADSLRAPAPAPLHARCRALAARPTASGAPTPPRVRAPWAGFIPRGAWSSRVGPLALAASLTLIVGGAFLIQATRRSEVVLAAELTADHVKCLAINRVLGTHDEPAAVESSMMSGFNWMMHLPENPERAGMKLVGSRPCLYGDGKIAHIMYRHEGNPVSLFMLPETSRAERLVRVLGHEAKIWCVGNRTFVLLAREPQREVERMASFVRSSLH
jgi:anti-sigma factor RsiW